MFGKIAFEMTELKKTTTTLHECESVHICHRQFPRVRRARHTYWNLPLPSATSRLQMWGSSPDTWALKNYSHKSPGMGATRLFG